MHCVVRTDHQSLRYFLNQPSIRERHIKWATFLQNFHFQIVYKLGNENIVAYALSRRPIINNISIAFHNNLEIMKEHCLHDNDF